MYSYVINSMFPYQDGILIGRATLLNDDRVVVGPRLVYNSPLPISPPPSPLPIAPSSIAHGGKWRGLVDLRCSSTELHNHTWLHSRLFPARIWHWGGHKSCHSPVNFFRAPLSFTAGTLQQRQFGLHSDFYVHPYRYFYLKTIDIAIKYLIIFILSSGYCSPMDLHFLPLTGNSIS